MSEKLAIVTISYNQADFLKETMESVLRQNIVSNYIVVDPGSRDGSRDIIASYGSKITAVLEPDSGPADGLNKGFRIAQGDILGYINSDDIYLPGSFQWVLDFFSQNKEVDVLVGGILIIDRNGIAKPWSILQWNFNLVNFLDRACTPVQPGIFMRKKAFEKTHGFNAENRSCWDTELLIDLALANCRIVAVSRTLAASRLYPESITGSGRFTAQIEIQHKKLDEKIIKKGHLPSTFLKARLKRFLFRYSFRRRIAQIFSRYFYTQHKSSRVICFLENILLRP